MTKQDAFYLITIAALVLGQFIWDCTVPNGLSEWVIYFIPLYLSSKLTWRYSALLAAAFITPLMLLAFNLAPKGIDPGLALNGRFIGIGTLWLMAGLITQQKKSERRLRQETRVTEAEGDAQFYAIINASPVAMALHDRSQRFTYVNPTLTASFGYTLEDIPDVSHWWTAAYPDPDYRKEVSKQWRTLAEEYDRTGKPFPPMEVRIRCKDGSERHVLTSMANLAGKFSDQKLVVFHDITAFRQAEQELSTREEIFSSIVNQAAAAIVLIDAETARFVEFNPAAYEGLGYTAEEFSELGIVDIQAEHTTEQIRRNIELIRSPGGLSFETRHRHRDGSLRDVRVSARTIQIRGRDFIAAIWNDITEAKRAQVEQANQQRFVADLIEFNKLQIYVKDAAGHYRLVNRAFEEISDRARDQVLGRTDAEVFPGPDGERFRQNDLEVMASGAGQTVEEQLTGADGQVRTFISTKFPVRDTAGAVTGVCGVTLEITDRKRIEAAHTRLAAVVEQGSEAVMITDLQGAIQYVNPAFEKITGYTAAEVQGQNPRLLKSGKQAEAFYRDLWDTLVRGEIWRGHFVNRRKDGNLFEEDAVISPMRDAGGQITGYVATKHDVTREVQLEAQFRQAQKMEAVGRLAGGVAHDFNNILQAILGFCDILLEGLPAEHGKREDVLEIRKAANRAASLTRQLLAFSRRQVLMPVVLDLNQLILNTRPMLQRLIGEDIKLDSQLAGDLPRITADAGNLDQVVLNLVVNARDAMPEGGRLTIRTEKARVKAKDLKPGSTARAGDFACLVITDTGCGMSKEILEHIFEPFFSTKGPEKGTGLGLSVIYGIVEQHQGWIDVQSEIGKGTTFRLYFPAYQQAQGEPVTEKTVVAAPDISGHGERLLILEDDPVIGALYVRALERAGFQTTLTRSIAEARARFDQEQGHFDLLFTDVILPDGNGLVLASELRGRRPDLAVLVCSGYTDDRVRINEAQRQGFTYTQKPAPLQDLLRIIREILDRRPKAGDETPG